MKGINWWERPRRIPGQHLFPSAFSQSYCISPLPLHKFEFGGKLLPKLGWILITWLLVPALSQEWSRAQIGPIWRKGLPCHGYGRNSQSLTAETKKQLVVIKNRAILKIKLAQNGGNTEKECVSLLILSINRCSGYLLYRSFHHSTFSYVRQQIFWGK